MPTIRADVRYYCVTLATQEPILGLDYLRALAKVSELQACPIGPAFLTAKPWSDVSYLFAPKEFEDGHYTNIICAPMDMMTGDPIRARDLSAPPGVVPDSRTGSDEVVYQPRTAFGSLYTLGVPNIAITLPGPQEPSDSEKRILAQYEAIWTPTERAAGILQEWGVFAVVRPPESLYSWRPLR